jgi:hypothetical protein
MLELQLEQERDHIGKFILRPSDPGGVSYSMTKHKTYYTIVEVVVFLVFTYIYIVNIFK